jgi:Protein of unknown function (DUF3341)
MDQGEDRMAKAAKIYGLMAEFGDATALVAAAQQTREAGYTCVDAYTPYAVEELHHALRRPPTKLPLIVLIGGLLGCGGGYLMQYWISAIAFPLNVGGRPFHSWPAFIPVTFECTVLAAALSTVLGMLALNGLPQPYHPVFNVPRFALASRNRFFLCIEAVDPKFDLEGTRHFLETLNPREVSSAPE